MNAFAMKILFLGFLTAASLGLTAGTAGAKVAGDPFAGVPALSEAALDDLRGGLRIGRFSFNFGLTVRSTIRGSMEMITQLTMDAPGQWHHVATNAWFPPTGGDTTEESVSADIGQQVQTASHQQNQSSSGNQPPQTDTHSSHQQQSSGNPPAPPPSNGPQTLAADPSGGLEVAIGDPQGSQIVHQVAQGHLAALVSNRLDGREIESIAQLDITIANFREIVGPLLPTIRARRIVRGLGQP